MNISCVLCTYNGEKYIFEQLESISRQTIKIDKLIICDDASTDRTVDVVLEWIKQNDMTVDFYRNDVSLGPTKNFEKALSFADSDYIFFADQDDVWLSDKIELSLDKIKSMEARYGEYMPCLVHSDLTVVDSDLQTVHKSFLKNQGLQHIYVEQKQLPYLMVQNFVTGCTMVINRALKEKSMPFPENIIMHDYWLALVAAMTGGIGFVDKPTILYRQHGHNTVGAAKYLSLSSICKALDAKGMLARIDATVKQLRVVCAYKNGQLVTKNKCITEFLKNIDEQNYLKVLLSNVRKQGTLLNIAFRYYLMRYMAKR